MASKTAHRDAMTGFKFGARYIDSDKEAIEYARQMAAIAVEYLTYVEGEGSKVKFLNELKMIEVV